MELKLDLSISEKVDLDLFLSHLCRRFVESEHCITDSDYKRVELLCMSTDEYRLVSKLRKSLANL